MENLKKIYLKYQEGILYLFYGGLTTVVNFFVFYFCKLAFHTTPTISNTIAWIAAVIFAFLTNKFFVFKAESTNLKTLLKEAFDFVAARLVTGVIEQWAMWQFVEKMKMNDFIIKVLISIFVVITNYIISKLIVFKKQDKTEQPE